MAKAILTAKVAIVRFGKIEIEGLLFEDGSLGVAIPQLARLDFVPPNRSQKQIEALLGISLPSHRKAKTDINSKAVNTIDLLDFERILRKLDKSNHPVAESMADALIGLSLQQLFSDAFDIEFEKIQRQTFLATRITDIPDKTKPKHFSDDWQKEAERVTGYQWQGYPMANFIRRWVYDLLGVKVTQRLNEVNPYKEGTGRRENLHYQHFDTDADERVLKAHISEILTLLKVSQSEFDFERLMKNRFGDGVQLDLF